MVLRCYLATDRSKTNRGTGCRIYTLGTVECINGSVEHKTTVFQSEIEAIKILAEPMINDDFKDRSFVIAADSKLL